MRKKVLHAGLSFLLVTGIVVLGESLSGNNNFVFAKDAGQVEKKTEQLKVKGKITNISQKAKSIALSKKDKSFFLVKFNDKTTLKGVKSSREFKPGEAILVQYETVNGENIALSLQKAIVKLPKGVKEVKTEELADLLKEKKDIVLIDARPSVKYGENHIAGAISIPFSKVVKKGDEASKLFDKYKGKQLIFYCGGPT